MGRYEAGETLASIARTYDCSPPAISYVVSRSRAREAGPDVATKPPGGSEPQLIKISTPDGIAALAVKPPTPVISVAAAAPNGHDRPEAVHVASNHPPRDPNGFPGTVTPDRPPALPSMPQASDGRNGPAHPAAANGDHRRTLHLSLGNPAPRNGNSHSAEMKQDAEPSIAVQPTPEPAQPAPPMPHNGQDAAASNGASSMRPTGYPEHNRRNDAETAPRKNGGAFIDHELRARVDGDIAAFLAAFDSALGQDNQENRAALREATDRLLRAGARTRIELERLEARMPLPARNDGRSGEAAWRSR